MTKLNGKTLDLAAENIEQLRQIFPDVFEEGKIDFDKLRQVLGEYVDDDIATTMLMGCATMASTPICLKRTTRN